jgi:hypothetical protein
MSSEYALILEEFEEELDAITTIVGTFSTPRSSTPKTRVAAINSTSLLLAATFEEFIREMARSYARHVVRASPSFDLIPSKISRVAWRRSLETLSRMKIGAQDGSSTRDTSLMGAYTKFQSVYNFCRGDVSQDIYEDLIHNENNMRSSEINNLFGIAGLKNICFEMCGCSSLARTLNESDKGKLHSQVVQSIDEFFERRNLIAHSLSIMRSVGPDQISKDINFFRALGFALREVLESCS